MAPRKVAIAALAVASLGALAAADSDIKVEDAIPGPPIADSKADKIKAITPTDPWKPSSVKIPDGSLADQFASEADFNKHWIPSRTQKEDIPADSDEKDKDLWRYRGVWKVQEPIELNGSGPGDLGLVLQSPAAHHAISRRLPKPVQFKGKDTITIQYEVKLQNGLECGGAYIKLLSQDDKFDPAKFSDKSPYTIMFGPDKCGATNKVHFIFRHANKKTGNVKEHHLKNPPSVPSTTSKETHLYTLLIHPESNTYEIKVDNESKQKGSLLDDFEPPVVPPKEIDDPNDKKPEGWVEEAKIPDSKATKPLDWDESAPQEIDDPNATKPEDWLDNEQEFVPDPDAKKPEDWDDEEDGDWIAPSIPNPKCASVSGCGVWKQPKIKNPDYKGKWTAPLIDNPAYKGVWKPRKISNPEYIEDKHPGYMTPIGAIGLELWTMQDKILFDNILVSDSITATQLATWTKDTWTKKHEVESALIKALDPETVVNDGITDLDKGPEPLDFKAQFSLGALQKFASLLLLDPAKAVQQFPLLVGALGAVIATVFMALFSYLFGGSSPSPSPLHKKGSKKVEDQDKLQGKVQEQSGDESAAVKAKSTSAKSSPSKQDIRKRAGSNKKDQVQDDDQDD